MTKRSITDEDNEPARRPALSAIIKDPVLSARQIAADNLLITSLIAPVIDIENLKAALASGANPDRIVWKDHPALHVAVVRQSVEAVQLLLEHDVSIEDVNAEGATAFDEAHRLGFKPGIRMLDMACAQLNRNNEHGPNDYLSSYQALIDTEVVQCAANHRRSPRELETAIALGGRVNPGGDKAMPLFLAIAACAEAKVDLLLQAGAALTPDSSSEGTALAQLWHARDHQILSPEWQRLYARILELGGGDIYSKPLDQFTLRDLRQPLGLPQAFGRLTVLHHLVRCSHYDFVLRAIERDPGQKIKAEDFLKTVHYAGSDTTLIGELSSQNKVEAFLGVNVWQDRLYDLLELVSEIDSGALWIKKIDCEPYVNAVKECRIKKLHAQALKKPRFKGF